MCESVNDTFMRSVLFDIEYFQELVHVWQSKVINIEFSKIPIKLKSTIVIYNIYRSKSSIYG